MRTALDTGPAPPTPAYLETVYWWAYLHPNAIWFFERQWLVNVILFGNYARLRDAALNALGQRLPGLTLQFACVYGDFTSLLSQRVRLGEGRLDVVDVVPGQLANLRRKLAPGMPARMLLMDCGALDLPDARYDRAVLFFLLHEQPEDWRRRTLAEAFRVVRPGGRIVIVEYARPRWWHPLRYALRPILARLEPFALDVWREEIETFFPTAAAFRRLRRRTRFGGLYQEITIERKTRSRLSRRAIDCVCATFEGFRQATKDAIEDRPQRERERGVREIVFSREFDMRTPAAGVLAKRPGRFEAPKWPVDVDDANCQASAIESVPGREALADRPQSDFHLGDQGYGPARPGSPSACSGGKAKWHEVRVALEIGDQIEHVRRDVPDMTRAVKRRHQPAPRTRLRWNGPVAEGCARLRPKGRVYDDAGAMFLT